jgi:hypothetical protein
MPLVALNGVATLNILEGVFVKVQPPNCCKAGAVGYEVMK